MNNVTPKQVIRAEEDHRVAQLQHENRNTLASAAKLMRATHTLARLAKQVDLNALAAYRKQQAKMSGNG